jgi:hypothetical protein
MSTRSRPATAADPSSSRTADRYARLARMIATDECVILDGAIGTELIKVGGERPEVEEHVWGLTALLDSPETVKAVHRRYIDVGCDVASTRDGPLDGHRTPGGAPRP